MTTAPASWWFTAAEIAGMRLPGLPDDTRRVHDRAKAEAWAERRSANGSPLARRRVARGGGTEYHASVLPAEAQERLCYRGADRGPATTANDDEASTDATASDIAERWEWFEGRSAKVKAEATRRLSILREVDDRVTVGIGKGAAATAVAAAHGTSRSVIFEWFKMVAGVPVADRLPFLAPRHKGGQARVEIDDGLWQYLLSDFLRLSRPSFATCVRRTEALAKERGLKLPNEKTLLRRFEKAVPRDLVTLMREGPDALRQSLPPQRRTVAGLHAMELVNIDGHTCDVRVQFKDGSIGRPVLIAIQDVYSRKFLAWRYAPSEDAITARLCFADLFAKYGVPKGLLSDNGRAFASKWLTGGTKTRFRFKVKPDEPVGLLPMLGVTIHWALPFRGSSKPIERGFRDFCDGIARHPAFEGAYTGNNALNKPDNYGERVVSWETFTSVWDAGIHAHNAQTGRRTEMGQGKFSFDEVFEASYAVAPIGKAPPQTVRVAMLAAEQVRADRKTATVKVLGNSYWSPELSQVAGDLVTVRFDPEDATQPVYVYDHAGRFIALAPATELVGFLDAGSAKRRSKLIADHGKATKAAAHALNLLEADKIAAMLPSYEDEEPIAEPTVIRPVRARGVTAAALKTDTQAEHTPAQPAVIDRFTAGVARLRVVE